MSSTVIKEVYPILAGVVPLQRRRHGKRCKPTSTDLSLQLARVEELLTELEVEHRKALATNDAGQRVPLLTHEIAEKLSNVLDQVYYGVWVDVLAPRAAWSSPSERKKAGKRVYFPIFKPGQRRSAVGRFIESALASLPDCVSAVDDAQSHGPHGPWLHALKYVARQKHMRLLPQHHREPYVAIQMLHVIGRVK